MRGVTARLESPPDHLGDAWTGPHLGWVPAGARSREQMADQLLALRLGQLRVPTRRGTGRATASGRLRRLTSPLLEDVQRWLLKQRPGTSIVVPRRCWRWLTVATRGRAVERASKYAVGVGSVLIAINHGDAILSGHVDAAALIKMSFTVLVPYCVSTASSVAAILEQAGREQGPAGSTRICDEDGRRMSGGGAMERVPGFRAPGRSWATPVS
jgi:hypothetical protein